MINKYYLIKNDILNKQEAKKLHIQNSQRKQILATLARPNYLSKLSSSKNTTSKREI